MSMDAPSHSGIPVCDFDYDTALTNNQMKKVDYYAMKKFQLPVELMMENAGYQLAKLASKLVEPGSNIEMGIGIGNNGGGGLVAARRLVAWGYNVYLDFPDIKLSELPLKQASRAVAFGAEIGRIQMPDLFIDCYFGFSQRLPLPEAYNKRIHEINQYLCKRLSLDIPSGLTEEESDHPFIFSDVVCALGAPKKVLNNPELTAKVFVADIGLPTQAFTDLGFENDLPFHENSLVQLLL